MRRGTAPAPTRASIDPSDLTALLPQIFIAGREAAGQYPLRLMGGFIAELHGRNPKGENLLRLWDSDSRARVIEAIEAARHAAHPLVVACEARTEAGFSMAMEILIAPLVGPSGAVDRLMGLYQPLSPVATLRSQPVGRLTLRAVRRADGGLGGLDRGFPRPRLATIDGRRVAWDERPDQPRGFSASR